MLGTLRIKNLALVTDLTLCLQPGYNAITGETGAGKSIIIGALNLLLGERADRALIRAGCDSCSVEAVLEGGNAAPAGQSFWRKTGWNRAPDKQLILKRVFTAAGANRQFINGSPATLQVLAALGRELVDMHGPHDHQSLLDPARQRDILDAFAGLGALRGKFAALAGAGARVGGGKGGADRGRARLRAAIGVAPRFKPAKLPPPNCSRRRRRGWNRNSSAPATPRACWS